jgi:hypothetical protein
LYVTIADRVRRISPYARPEEIDLFTRWPSGQRTVMPRWVLFVFPLVPMSLVSGPLKPVVPEWLWLSLSLLVGAFGFVVLGWFVTFVRVREVLIRSVQHSSWVVPPDGTRSAFSATAVMVAGDCDAGLGQDFYLATKTGAVYAASATATVRLLEVRDPFARFRVDLVPEPLPAAAA